MAIVDYMERFSNSQRLDQAMGHCSPEEFSQRVVRNSRVCCSEATSARPHTPRMRWSSIIRVSSLSLHHLFMLRQWITYII